MYGDDTLLTNTTTYNTITMSKGKKTNNGQKKNDKKTHSSTDVYE
jgi:hypothetical protein